MRWPWTRHEKRAAPYTNALLAAHFAAATGNKATAVTTAALESCAAIYSASLAACRVDASPELQRLLTPGTLALIARNLIRTGQSIHLIEIMDSGLQLLPVGSWDFRGSHNRDDWTVRCDLFGPSTAVTRHVPYGAVVDCKYAVDPYRPWLGLGPLQFASATGALVGRIETGLSAEAGAPSAQLVPVPTDGGDAGDDDPLKQLKTDIATAKGNPLLVETTAAGWGQGHGGAPRSDWKQTRIGPDWPDVLRETRQDAFDAVVVACNVPPALLDKKAEGTSQREALRRFAHLALEPLGKMISAELSMKLDAPVMLDFEPLMAADIAGRARAFKGFVEAGLTIEQAAAIVAVDAG